MSTLLGSIIIAVHNDNRIQRGLDSLVNQSIDRQNYEIIVVENGSNELEDICKKYQVIYLSFPEANMPAARNAGLNLAQTNNILFTDADCVAETTWVEKMIYHLENSDGKIAGVGGKIKRYNPSTIAELYGNNLVDGQDNLNYLPILNLPYVATANAAFKKNILIEIAGFDDELRSGNDVDLCYKIGLLGYKLDICNGAVIYHENRKTAIAHYRRFYRYAFYQVLLFKKYKPIHKKKFVFNIYPFECFKKALFMFPDIVKHIIRKDLSLFWINYFLIIEGLGVLIGDIEGSIKFRVLYL